MEEKELISRIIKGETQYFEKLMETYQKQVYNLCLRMAGNPEDAFDLSQESFLKAWRNLGAFRQESSFSTWLFRLTANTCLDFLRKQKKNKTVSLTFSETDEEPEEYAIPDPGPSPETLAEDGERQAHIRAALNGLPVDFREILTLRAMGQRSYEEIGEILSLPPGTVKSRLCRARKELEKRLGNYLEFPSSNQAERGRGQNEL